jgi:hypothetical protein
MAASIKIVALKVVMVYTSADGYLSIKAYCATFQKTDHGMEPQ